VLEPRREECLQELPSGRIIARVAPRGGKGGKPERATRPAGGRAPHDRVPPLSSQYPQESFEPYAQTIKLAFVYGSVTNGTDTASSDIDLMVIGDNLDFSELYTPRHSVPKASSGEK
jgi:hypothetical protein